MARIKLEFPDHVFHFETRMPVRITDINAANHLGNDALISMLSEARARFLAARGIREMGEDGIGIIVTDLATMYQGESFYPDVLRFEVGIADFNRYGADFVFRVTKADSGQAVAMAKYGFVFFNYRSREVTPLPEGFRARFEAEPEAS